MEISAKNTTNPALMNARLRRIAQLAYENTLTVDINKAEGDPIEMLSNDNDSNSGDEWCADYRTFVGLAPSPFADYSNMVYRRNLILTKGDLVLLQRFSYPQYRSLVAQRKAVAEGYRLLQEFYAIAAKPNNNNANRTESARIYSFCVWHEQGKTKPIVTSDTEQDTGKIGRLRRKAVEAFIKWFRTYATNYIQPLLEPQYNMHPTIRASYEKRAQVYQWLIKELPAAEDLAHPMFAAMSTFSTFSPGKHDDRIDMEYSFMVNFGGSCYVSMPGLGVRTHMQPLDTVFFRTKDIEHLTCATPTTSSETSPRWGVSGYVRSAFAKSAGVQ